jgi:hypothetical protein
VTGVGSQVYATPLAEFKNRGSHMSLSCGFVRFGLKEVTPKDEGSENK